MAIKRRKRNNMNGLAVKTDEWQNRDRLYLFDIAKEKNRLFDEALEVQFGNGLGNAMQKPARLYSESTLAAYNEKLNADQLLIDFIKMSYPEV